MSSERHFASKSYHPRRKKRSYWKPIGFLCVLGGAWLGYLRYWPTIESWFKPTIHEVQSQTQAMNHLQDMLAAWNGTDAELAKIAAEADKQTDWMNSTQAKDSFTWLLASELDRRGMYEQAEPMLMGLLEKKLAHFSELAAADQDRLLESGLIWASTFAERKHDGNAEKLYEIVLKQTPEDRVSVLLACLDPLGQYAYDRANFEQFSVICAQATSPVMRSRLKKMDDVRRVVKLLLMQDTLPDKSGVLSDTGSVIAKDLLTHFQMTASPEMGRIILNELRMPLSSRKKYDRKELKAMADSLESALVCFRGAVNDLDYTPETMLALAGIRMQMGDLTEAARLLSRAEGAAMTLGVDTPRILDGSSLSQEINDMRAQLEKYSKAESLIKRAYEDVNIAAAFLKAGDSDQADKYLNQALAVAQENTSFSQALLPVIFSLQAETLAVKNQWAIAEARYAKLIEEWDALSDQDKVKLQENLSTIKSDDLYKKVHRDWANVCKKQNRTTEARRVLTKIDEAPPEEPESNSRRRRRSN